MTYEEWKKGINTPQEYAIYNASTVKQLVERIDTLEQWIAAIADDHPQIPDWIQQSARSLLAQESE